MLEFSGEDSRRDGPLAQELRFLGTENMFLDIQRQDRP
jgi:hypothetical protein